MVQIEAPNTATVVPNPRSPRVEVASAIINRTQVVFIPAQDAKVVVRAQQQHKDVQHKCRIALTFDLLQIPVKRGEVSESFRTEEVPTMGGVAQRIMSGPRPSSHDKRHSERRTRCAVFRRDNA